LLLVALTLMWGVNWPMMKFSLRELSPLWFRAWTMTGGAVLLLLFFRWRGVDLRVPRGRWLAIAGLALPNILGWHGLSIVGLSGLPSGRAAILGFTMPVWTVLVAILLGEQHLSRRVLISVVAATAAVGLLAAHELNSLAGHPIAVLWMQGAALCWALGTVLMRRSQLGLPIESVTVWMMVLGAVCFWIIAPLQEPFPTVEALSAGLWWSLVYGVVLNYGYAQVIWFGMAKVGLSTALINTQLTGAGLAQCVDTAGAETLPPSHTHFTAAGTLEIGRRYAEALLSFESAK
jgi:drug/metabolite transporter (DMT)-like permease